MMMHLLASGIETQFDDDAARPVFRQLVTPWRKSLGDNADAMYHDAKVHPAGVYRIRGNTGGAVYVSCTVEAGAEDGGFPTGTLGVLNDTQFDIGRRRPLRARARRPGARPQLARARAETRPASPSATTGSKPEPPAVPPAPDLALQIELVDGDVPDRSARTDRRVGRGEHPPGRELRAQPDDGHHGEAGRRASPPAFVSRIPHAFPPPVTPGDHALAAADAAYSMAPYLLGPDEALVITARWPQCRCANVNLWNRQLQTFDYLRHRDQPQPRPDRDRRRRHVPGRDRRPGPRRRELARHRGPPVRTRLLALHAAGGTDRHAAGRGRPARLARLTGAADHHGSSSTSNPSM